MRILVTGAAGFVGRRLLPRLLGLGHEVTALVRPDQGGPASGVVEFAADLAAPGSLEGLPRRWDQVIHLAAASVPNVMGGYLQAMDNVGMAVQLLDHLESGRVLLVSSAHVYGPSPTPHEEDEPLSPRGPYGLSKHLMEQSARAFEHRLDIRIARPFNHVGPGMPSGLLLPSLLERLAASPPGEPILMQGRDSVRDFIAVEDVVEAYLAILGLEAPAERCFNVCTGRGVSVGELVRMMMSILGRQERITFSGESNSPGDVSTLVGSPHRLVSATGWMPKVPLQTSLGLLAASLRP